MATVFFTLVLYGLSQVSIGKPTTQDDIEEHLENNNFAQQSTPFPRIPGPKSLDDRIAIVGAGASGIHMAYRLKNAGFKRVTVFEKDDDVGGKSRTVYHRRVPHEMGTCYSQPDYTAIYDLINEFDTGDILPLPSPSLFVENITDALTTLENIFLVTSEKYPNKNVSELGTIFQNAVIKYVILHDTYFGTYEGELMQRPSPDILANLSMNFLEFLQHNDIEILKPVFLSALTVQGYGQVDNISALYGMMWMTPNFLLKVLDVSPPGDEVRYTKVLEKGYQFLWQEIYRQSNLNVRLSTPVIKIKRRRGDFRLIYRECNRRVGVDVFDFLILSPAMKDMSSIIRFNEEENDLFQRTFSYFYTTTLVDTTLPENRGSSPVTFYFFNVESGVDDAVWGYRNSYQTLTYRIGDNFTLGEYPGAPDGSPIQTSVYYQLSEKKPNSEDLLNILESHIETFDNATIVEILQQNIWPYFPRYSVSDMANGILWDIFDIQGKYGIWYIGSSVIFESVKSVVEYNNLILRQYDLPDQ